MEDGKSSLALLLRRGRTLGAVLVGVGAVLACVGLRSTAPPVFPTSIVPGGVVVLVLGLIGAAVCGATLWWSLLVLVGARRRWSTVVLAWCGGTPAKYLPGKVGSVVARAALLGEPHAIHGATATAEVLLTLAVGGLIALVIPLEWTSISTPTAAVAVGALSVGIVWFARRRLGPVPPASAGVGPWVAAAASVAAGWLGQGLALGGAMVAVGGRVSSDALVLWSGIAGAGAIAGVISPTPAGLGPRDAVLGLLVVALLDDDVGRVAAAVFSWRVASVAVELALAAGAGLAIRWRAVPVTDAGHEARP